MLLSEAIRLGAMMKKKSTVAWSDEVSSCTVGAALDAMGVNLMTDATHPYTHMFRLWPWTQRPVVAEELPEGISVYTSPRVGKAIAAQLHMLNCVMTREQVADWVATIEPKEHHDIQSLANQDVLDLSHSTPALARRVD